MVIAQAGNALWHPFCRPPRRLLLGAIILSIFVVGQIIVRQREVLHLLVLDADVFKQNSYERLLALSISKRQNPAAGAFSWISKRQSPTAGTFFYLQASEPSRDAFFWISKHLNLAAIAFLWISKRHNLAAGAFWGGVKCQNPAAGVFF